VAVSFKITAVWLVMCSWWIDTSVSEQTATSIVRVEESDIH
jgi:hypothetical protein